MDESSWVVGGRTKEYKEKLEKEFEPRLKWLKEDQGGWMRVVG